MPDVWTFNPEKVKTLLTAAGGRCGVESRVLKPRDPEWTCRVDGGIVGNQLISYDVYIHPAEEFYLRPPGSALLIMVLVGGIFTGLLWGKRFWHARAHSTHPSP